MTPLAWLAGLFMPACSFPAVQGLPPPGLMDVAAIVRPSSPNTALAAPEGFSPTPDIVMPDFSVAPGVLFGAIRAIAKAQPRTFEAADFPDHLQAHYIVRSLLLNYPDQVMVQVRAAGPGSSQLILYSRSVYGHSDLGVNRKRLETWLVALRTSLPSHRK